MAHERRRLSADAEEYLSYLQVEKGRAKNSIIAYRRDLEAYETYLFERELCLEKVDNRVVEDYLGLLRASGLKEASRARALVAVRGLHRFCVDERGFSADPTDEIEGPKVSVGLPKALREDEVAALLNAPDGRDALARRDRALLELLYASGLRISELSGLSLGDVDLREGLVRCFGKGSKERIVPIGSVALAALEDYLGPGGREELLSPKARGRDDRDALFVSSRGRRMSRQAAFVVVKRHAQRVGLGDKVSPHVLRHSFATHLLDHGADVRVVQELLGHASISTTQIYTKVSDQALRRAYLAAHPRATRSSSSKVRVVEDQVPAGAGEAER